MVVASEFLGSVLYTCACSLMTSGSRTRKQVERSFRSAKPNRRSVEQIPD